MAIIPKIKLINGKNYNKWVHTIEPFLTMRKQYDLVSGKEMPPTEQRALEKWDQRNKEAGAYIKICMSYEVFVEIKNLRDGIEIWKRLKDLYHNTSESWILNLTSDLHNLKLSNNQEIAPHLTKLKDLRNELESLGKTLVEKEVVHIILHSLLINHSLDGLILLIQFLLFQYVILLLSYCRKSNG